MVKPKTLVEWTSDIQLENVLSWYAKTIVESHSFKWWAIIHPK